MSIAIHEVIIRRTAELRYCIIRFNITTTSSNRVSVRLEILSKSKKKKKRSDNEVKATTITKIEKKKFVLKLLKFG